MDRTFRVTLFLLAIATLSVATALGQDREPDVLYVPTPQPVVNEMLRLVDLQEGELLYDLGSGDGRFVITAARDFGARGVGIDIDLELVEESRRNAEEAGVADRVAFIHGDLFEFDFSDADVVTLFLLTDLNLQLRPTLLSTLRPGTRVVSHLFGMREWRPDQVLLVEGPERNHEVYLWIIPSDVSGIWDVSFGTVTHGDARLVLDQQFQEVSGFLEREGRRFVLTESDLRGDALTLSFGHHDVSVTLKGVTSADTIEGEAVFNMGDVEGRDRWTARRTSVPGPGSSDADH